MEQHQAEDIKIDIDVVPNDTNIDEWRQPYIKYLKDKILLDYQKL